MLLPIHLTLEVNTLIYTIQISTDETLSLGTERNILVRTVVKAIQSLLLKLMHLKFEI